MATHRTRVGLHGRNDVRFTEGDFALIRTARIETLKTMSHTEVDVYRRLRQKHPDLEFIVRLFDDRLSSRSHPSPSEFVARMVPIINALKPYALKFEVHNEPNHAHGIEGWGATDAEARDFFAWYMRVLPALKRACPWARFGFPGLALNHPHRDLEWLAICREAVVASDWLGCHCYWQNDNMLSDQWGLRFKLYHQRFPEKRIEITEFGNSTPGLGREEMARQYVRYYAELNRYFYLGSASAFIASSPDPAWAPFAWMREGGEILPVAKAVGTMARNAVETIRKRTFPETGKTVSGSFLDFFERYGQSFTGNPITNQFKENGVPSQYFERLALEEPAAGKVRLKAVGSEAITSRGKIAKLQELVDTLSAEPLTSAESTIDHLSDVVDSLAAQVTALRSELARLESEGEAADDAVAQALSTLQEQVDLLQQVSDALHVDLAAALKAMSEEQSALIETLQARVQELETELGKKKAKVEVPAPQPPIARQAPDIQNVVDKLPHHKTKTFRQRARTDIRRLVIHHSAVEAAVLPEAIARYHVDEWQWPGIGYHFVVAADGTLYQTNALESISFHASAANEDSAGICFLGNFTDSPPTADQVREGAALVAWLLEELGLDIAAIFGHREIMQTACPGNQWLSGANWKQTLLDEVALLQQPVA